MKNWFLNYRTVTVSLLTTSLSLTIFKSRKETKVKCTPLCHNNNNNINNTVDFCIIIIFKVVFLKHFISLSDSRIFATEKITSLTMPKDVIFPKFNHFLRN